MKPVLFDWQAHHDTGWGIIGIYLARALTALGVEVHLPYELGGLVPEDIQPLVKPTPAFFRGTALHATGNGLYPPALYKSVVAERNILLPVFEDLRTITPETAVFCRNFDAVVTLCHWNRRVLDQHGVRSSVTWQGVDQKLFHGPPDARVLHSHHAVGPFADSVHTFPLRVFSGGKLEYRKGQDITIAAFKRILQSEPDAVLVTAWHNHWPHIISGLSLSPHLKSVPTSTAPDELTRWLVSEGIPEHNQEHHHVRHAQMPDLIRSCDIALLPSRAEGATNLPAVEAAACGIETLVSSGTGHDDLADDETGVFRRVYSNPGSLPDWREVDPEDLATCALAAPFADVRPNRPLPSWSQMATDLLPLLS